MKILIVKTWSENKNVQEAERYLEYNNYGSVKNIIGADLFLCLLGDLKPIKLSDVKIIDE